MPDGTGHQRDRNPVRKHAVSGEGSILNRIRAPSCSYSYLLTFNRDELDLQQQGMQEQCPRSTACECIHKP